MYAIMDSKTQLQVGTAKTLKGASRSCERRNQEYGAVRYVYVYKESDHGKHLQK